MRRWEYKHERLVRGRSPADSVDWLNKQGKEGWELVCVVDSVCFFKREAEPA